MGRVRTLTSAAATAPASRMPAAMTRAANLVAGSVLLALALPLIAVLAIAVRRSSHGPVLHRERGLGRDGQPVDLVSFRTSLDGSGTVAHARVRAAVGACPSGTVTGVGRLMRVTRTDRLPRLFNVVAGHARLF